MSAQSLRDFYNTLFCPLFLRARSPRTKVLYESTIRTFGKFLQREPLLSDLTDETASRFLGWYRSLGRSPYSVNKERDNLLAMWRFAARKRLVEQFPDVAPDLEPVRIPQAWSRAEINRLFRACKKLEGWIAGVPAANWWLALHHVAWCSGERITAIISLPWSCVDLESGYAIMRAETRKGGVEDRQYKLSPDCIAALRAIELPRRPLVFPWPYSATYLWLKYKPILELAGLPTDRKSMFHRLRKSVASHYEAAGGDATAMLGHSSRRITEAYLDPKICTTKQASDLLFRVDSD